MLHTLHMNIHPIDAWLELARTRDAAALDTLLADDVVFISPVVHTPQQGKALTTAYLSGAFKVFFNPTFRYVREIIGPSDANNSNSQTARRWLKTAAFSSTTLAYHSG